MRILAVKWRRLGDTVLWTSALQALRDLFPQASIELAFPAPYHKVFEGDRRFEKLHLLSVADGENRRHLNEFRCQTFDWILNFHASHGSRRFLEQIQSRGRIYHHHSRSKKRFRSDLEVPHLGEPMPAWERDLNVIRALGWKGTPPPLHIYSDPLEIEWAKKHLEVEKRTGAPRKRVTLSVGASRPSKRWPSDRWVRLIHQLLDEQVEVVVVYESQGELGPLVHPQSFQNHPQRGHLYFCHTPQLSCVKGVLALSQVYVGCDSGLKHLAIALGVKTVTLFGPESVGEWHGYERDKNPVLQIDVACRTQNRAQQEFAWCSFETCPLGSHACMNLIEPQAVVEQVRTLLKPPLSGS